MIINTRNKSYPSKDKYDPPHTSSIPSSYSPASTVQSTKNIDNQGVPYPIPSVMSPFWDIITLQSVMPTRVSRYG